MADSKTQQHRQEREQEYDIVALLLFGFLAITQMGIQVYSLGWSLSIQICVFHQSQPKGRPIAVISANIFLLSKNDMECIQTHNNMMTTALLLRPPQPQPLLQESLSSYHIFAVSSSSSSVYHSNNHQKTQYFCVPGPIEEAQAWVNALHQAQEDGIRRELGHVPKDSYPSAWKHFDALGDGLLQTQDCLERHMAATTHSQTAMLFPELELSPATTSVGVGGAGGGGGYYG